MADPKIEVQQIPFTSTLFEDDPIFTHPRAQTVDVGR
jgi:hypothetical protein